MNTSGRRRQKAALFFLLFLVAGLPFVSGCKHNVDFLNPGGLSVCNETASTLYLVYAYNAGLADGNLLGSGWFEVPEGTCQDIGPLTRSDVFFFYAENDDYSWEGHKVYFCIDPDQDFSQPVRPITGEPVCETGLMDYGFLSARSSSQGSRRLIFEPEGPLPDGDPNIERQD